VSLRSLVEDDDRYPAQLLAQLRARVTQTLRFPKVHPAEISSDKLETLGFRPAGGHNLYATTPRSQ
jgi:hypothetical protein